MGLSESDDLFPLKLDAEPWCDLTKQWDEKMGGKETSSYAGDDGVRYEFVTGCGCFTKAIDCRSDIAARRSGSTRMVICSCSSRRLRNEAAKKVTDSRSALLSR